MTQKNWHRRVNCPPNFPGRHLTCFLVLLAAMASSAPLATHAADSAPSVTEKNMTLWFKQQAAQHKATQPSIEQDKLVAPKSPTTRPAVTDVFDPKQELPEGFERWNPQVKCDSSHAKSEVCELTVTFELPKDTLTCAKRRATPVRGPTENAAWWKELSSGENYSQVWVRSASGPPWDQHSAHIRVQVPWVIYKKGTDITGIPCDGMQEPPANTTNLCACVLADQPDTKDAIKCLNEGVSNCVIFNSYLNSDCVTDMQACTLQQRAACDNGLYPGRYVSIYSPGNPMCNKDSLSR